MCVILSKKGGSMPHKIAYKDWPEELKAKAREKSLKCMDKKKQDPVWMEKELKRRKEYSQRPEVKERCRIRQNEYYHEHADSVEWRAYVTKRSLARRTKRLYEEKGFHEKEKERNRVYSRTISGRALHLLKHAKYRSIGKVSPVTITKQWIIDRLVIGTCEVTGIVFKQENGVAGPYTASLDRIDNAKGYTPENTRLVIWAFNRAKAEWDDKILQYWMIEYLCRTDI
jgi:hypothetical protein